MRIFRIEPNGTVFEYEKKPDDYVPSRQIVCDAVGGNPEYVAVLFEGKRATLIVNEVGASTDPAINPAGQFPANARATAISKNSQPMNLLPASSISRKHGRWANLSARLAGSLG